MSWGRLARLLLTLSLVVAPALAAPRARAAGEAGPAAGASATEPEDAEASDPDLRDDAADADSDDPWDVLEEEPEQGLRQRLTEREDKRRPLRPFYLEVAGRPLVLGGEYELGIGYLRHRVLGIETPVRETDRFLLEQSLELEAFYSFGPELAVFAQAVVAMEEDLLSHTFEQVSDVFVERAEMWLYTERILGTPLYFDIGRLDFEDERRFWWDEELDAARLGYETDHYELVFAVARELAPARSDRSHVAPEHDRVLRLLAEIGWDYAENHALELFALRQSDHSRRERPGEIQPIEREDDSDARLLWVGGRLMGAFDLGPRGILGYWLDAAMVRGSERQAELSEISRASSEVESVRRRSVRGFAFDTGLSFLLPFALEPRVFLGYAQGSGDATPDTGTDRSFRQTELHGNESGFGGVERFNHYGIVLEPELSNLRVLTAGVGFSLLRSSSLDLVYHQYRLLQPAEELRDSRIEAELTGRHRSVGRALDLVLALEEWERFELELTASAFQTGRAFGPEHHTTAYEGFLAVRYAF